MGNNLSNNVYQTFSGKIAKTSKFGFQLMQHVDSERWLNYGNYFEGTKLESGDVGQEYTVNVQQTPAGAYYIKTIEDGIKGEDTVKAEDIPPKNVINKQGTVVPFKVNNGEDERTQVLIVRQNSISNACVLLQNQKNVDTTTVLKYASQFEEWVMRKEGDVPSIDLDDIPF